MSLFTQIRRILMVSTMLQVFTLQSRAIRTCKTNVFNKLTLLDINRKVRKPHVTRLYKRVEDKTKGNNLQQEFYKKSFRKTVMQHQDAFKLNGFITPMSCLETYNGPTTPYPFITNWRWYVTTKDQAGPVRKSGGSLGKLDARGEAGFFHKVNLSRLEQIKKMLREKRLMQKDAPKNNADSRK